MCARYTMRIASETVRSLFDVEEVPELEPRFNAAPTQVLPIVIEERDGTRGVHLMRWGFVPYWAKDEMIGKNLINAKSESIFEKPAFRNSAAMRRCLVPADGFFEWKEVPVESVSLFAELPDAPVKTRKQPYHITLSNGEPFAMAGLYDRWEQPDGERMESFTILTCPPNALVAELHDRMPVILEPRDYERWLDRDVKDEALLRDLLKPLSAEAMAARPVNSLVGNPRYDSPELLDPA